MIAIEVDEASPVPPYEQVRGQLERIITTGALTRGARLPTVRQLASDLGLAPNTVARAYRELEGAGLIETNGRRGTSVADVVIAPAARNRAIRDAAQRFHDEVLRVGGSIEDAVQVLSSLARS